MKNRSFVWTFMVLCFFVVSLSRCDCGAQGTPTVDIARYANCTQSKLENNSKYRKIQQELQKIVDKQIK